MASQYELTMRIGKTQLTIKTDSQKKMFQDAGFYGSLPDLCPRCGSPVRLSHRTYDKYDYYELICDGSKSREGEHKAKIGEHLDTETFFFRHDQQWLTIEELKDGLKHYDDRRQEDNDYDYSDEPRQRGQGRSSQSRGSRRQPPPKRGSESRGSGGRSRRNDPPPPDIPDDFDDLDDDLPF